MKGIVNRCGVLTGPWQMGKIDQGFVALWVARHLWNGELAYIGYGGTGKQVRDVLHVEDFYQLLKIQIERLDEFSGCIFNVGGGRELSVSLCELMDLCREVVGKKISISSIPKTRPADIPYYVTDYRLVQEATNWTPHRTLKDIICDISKWLQENEAILRPIFT